MKKSLIEVFEDRYCPEPNTGCWLWLGAVGGQKYRGEYKYGVFGKTYAHRWSYEHFKGPIPDGLTVDHKCKQRLCVNPSHLEAVTLRENIRRYRTTNTNLPINACWRGHIIDEANTFINIKEPQYKVCKICKNEINRKYYARKKLERPRKPKVRKET